MDINEFIDNLNEGKKGEKNEINIVVGYNWHMGKMEARFKWWGKDPG